MSEEVKMKQGKENTGRARIQVTLMLSVTNMVTNSNIITNVGSFVFFAPWKCSQKARNLSLRLVSVVLTKLFCPQLFPFFASTLEGGDGIE